MSNKAVSLRELLKAQLAAALERDKDNRLQMEEGMPVEVPSAGAAVSSAYEQLRKAAEYSEEHLLLERAIKRFYKRNLFITNRRTDRFGRELTAELVQAGYVPSDRIASSGVAWLDSLTGQYITTYEQLRQNNIKREVAVEWILALLSAHAEALINPHNRSRAFIVVCYQYFLHSIDRDHFADKPDSQSYELCLYIAAHQALLKSDKDMVRYDLYTTYDIAKADIQTFCQFNDQVDRLFSSELTVELRRIIGKAGAPFRVLKGLIDDRSDVISLLDDREKFMEAYQSQIVYEYSRADRRLNQGLVKSIVFIVITKTLIGLGIEIPYDLLMYGAIMWLPLIVNLVFPPIYMTGLRLSILKPSLANTKVLMASMERALFTDGAAQIHIPKRRNISSFRRVVYLVLFSIPVALSVVILHLLHFNIVQMLIFYIFFSTASSLGFRLSMIVRELEQSRPSTGFLDSIMEFFYLPFIISGQWLSRKYSQINIVARFLDVAIELPLKALLRLVRQWIRFLDERRDDLY